MTRRQFRLLAKPMLERHRLVYAFEWLPVVRASERALYEEEARDAGLTDYHFWEIAAQAIDFGGITGAIEPLEHPSRVFALGP